MSRAKRKERVMARPEQGQNLIQINQYLRKKTQVNIVPRNLSQETYLELLKNPKKYIFVKYSCQVYLPILNDLYCIGTAHHTLKHKKNKIPPCHPRKERRHRKVTTQVCDL